MLEVQLTKGRTSIIDAEDGLYLLRHKWRVSNNGYAIRSLRFHGKRFTTYMHRLITGAKDGVDVDHIDGDKLNNLKSNLRFCTRAQNIQHVGKRSNNTSGSKGVNFDKQKSLWRARITVNKRTFWLGYFRTVAAARKAYDSACLVHHGSFALPNDRSL